MDRSCHDVPAAMAPERFKQNLGTNRDWEPDLMGLGPTQGPESGKVTEKVGVVNRDLCWMDCHQDRSRVQIMC